MEEQYAEVVAREGRFAWVEARHRGACGACARGESCATGVVERFLGQRSTRVRALNPLDAQVGEGVLVGLQEGAILRGAVALYLVPLLALIGGAVVGGLLAAEIAPARADLLVGLAGGFGLLTGLGWARRFARRVHDDGRYQPVVLRRQE